MKRSRLKPVNPKRRRKLLAEQFGEQAKHCRSMKCVACGNPPPCEPHHAKTRGAGGKDHHCVGLCPSCHRAVHQMGVETFQERYGVDLMYEANMIAAELWL